MNVCACVCTSRIFQVHVSCFLEHLDHVKVVVLHVEVFQIGVVVQQRFMCSPTHSNTKGEITSRIKENGSAAGVNSKSSDLMTPAHPTCLNCANVVIDQ